MIKLEQGEHIFLEIRKHWFILFREVFYCFFLAILPIFLFPLLELIGFKIDLNFFSLSLFFYSLWILILWLICFIFWTNFYLDVWYVTDHKMFDIEQIGLFSREISVLRYEKIQDINYEISGIIPSLLNFGDITVQTAGAERNFIMKGIKNPAEVQKKINEIFLKCRRRHLSNGGITDDFNNLI
jgi:uncharacterized membrane protein YdbT with pleckstrin-like domain